MSQNISKCREGYGEGELASAAGAARGGDVPYGWGASPSSPPPPCPGVTQQGAPGSSFEDQPVCGSRWPGWGPPRPGSGPVGVSWQGIPDPPLAPGPPSSLTPGAGPWLEGCGLRTGKETKSRPLLPQEAELSLTPLPPSVGRCPAGAVAVRPEQEVGGLGSRGQAWLQAGFLPSLLSGQESERR